MPIFAPMKIKENILKLIDTDKALQGVIAKVADVEVITVNRWVAANSDRLLNLKVIEAIKAHTGKKMEDIVK